MSPIDDLWYLDANNHYGYQNWLIGGVQALEHFNGTIPEPTTFCLVLLGCIGMFLLKKKYSR